MGLQFLDCFLYPKISLYQPENVNNLKGFLEEMNILSVILFLELV